MNNLIFSLNTTMPIFLVMVIGYILKQIGMLNDNFVTVANKFNFKVTLPFMLFRDISTVNIREIFDLKYVLFCALASTACFWVIWGATKLFVKDNKFTRKAKRPLSLILAIVVILAVVTGVVVIVVPKLSDTLAQVVYTAQRSIPKLKVFVNQYVNDDQINEILNQYSNFDANKLFNMLIDFFRSDVTTNFLGSTVGVVRGIVNSVVNVAIGFVFAIYILLAKETLSRQISKSLKAIFNKKIYDYIIKVSELSYTTFANFITGQCLEAVIIGTLFVVSMSVFRMPYALLVGVLIGFTALIPFIGAFLGFVISALLILMVSPITVVYFAILFLVIQQIEGNLIYPHVVGGSVGLPSIWVLVALTVGGNIMGIVGILLFIPLSSVCYTLFCQWANKRLEKKEQREKVIEE